MQQGSALQRFSIALLACVIGLVATFLGEDVLRSIFLAGAHESSALPLLSGVIASLVLAILVYFGSSISATSQVLATQMNEELLFSRDQFQTLYDSSPVPYLITTPDGTITNPNSAACALFSLPKEALEGSNLFASIEDAKTDSIGIKERLKHSLNAERQEVRLTTQGGEQKWVLFSMHEVNTAGEYSHMGLVTLVDITGQKELERKKTEFLSLASHQLRTPLSRIRWFADMLLESSLSQQQRQYADSLYRANLLMIETVNTLLNMTRLELGTLEVEAVPCDLSVLLADILHDYHKGAGDKKIALSADIPQGVTIEADPKLLRVVVDNLLTNAIRYTPQGGEVSLSLVSDADSKTVRIMVSDTGCGIPHKDQDKIFTKQFRADNAKAMSNDGTGLGMYMTHQLLSLMGGSISFESKEGQGTRFLVSLPTSFTNR